MAELDGVTVDAGNESVTDTDDGGKGLDGLLSVISGLDGADDKEEEVVPIEEKPIVPAVKPEEKPETDRGLERLATKEKEVRTLKEAFDKERVEFEKIKTSLINPKDLDTNPNEVLKKLGIDEDQFMKRVLYGKLDDNHPLKAKLKTELADYLRDKRVNELEQKYESEKKQNAANAENQRVYQETIMKLDKYADTFKGEDNKTLPTLSKIGKKDVSVVRKLILKEMLDDAKERYISGQSAEPITHEDAAKKVEESLAILIPFIMDNTPANKSVPANRTATIKPGNPVPKTNLVKTKQQEMDEMIARVLG